MLSFPARDVAVEAAKVDAELAASDPVWMPGDAVPVDGIKVTGRLSAAGPGRFYFSGRIQGSARQECRRCLTEFSAEIAADAHFMFGDDEHQGADGADTFSLTSGRGGDTIDLRPAVREQWILETPGYSLCRPDCKGLCLACGADLNAGPHECSKAKVLSPKS